MEGIRDNGYIYKGSYTGCCVFDELYVDVVGPVRLVLSGRPTETVQEENYFFKLSAFQTNRWSSCQPARFHPSGNPA